MPLAAAVRAELLRGDRVYFKPVLNPTSLTETNNDIVYSDRIKNAIFILCRFVCRYKTFKAPIGFAQPDNVFFPFCV